MTEYKQQATEEQIRKALLEFPFKPADMYAYLTIGLREPKLHDEEGLEKYLADCAEKDIIPFTSETIEMKHRLHKETSVGVYSLPKKAQEQMVRALSSGRPGYVMIKGVIHEDHLRLIRKHLSEGYQFIGFAVSHGQAPDTMGRTLTCAYMGHADPGQLYLNGVPESEEYREVLGFLKGL